LRREDNPIHFAKKGGNASKTRRRNTSPPSRKKEDYGRGKGTREDGIIEEGGEATTSSHQKERKRGYARGGEKFISEALTGKRMIPARSCKKTKADGVERDKRLTLKGGRHHRGKRLSVKEDER